MTSKAFSIKFSTQKRVSCSAERPQHRLIMKSITLRIKHNKVNMEYKKMYEIINLNKVKTLKSWRNVVCKLMNEKTEEIDY